MSNAGDDANDGTEAAPWQTVQKVADELASLPTGEVNLIVHFRRGDTWQEVPTDNIFLSAPGRNCITFRDYGEESELPYFDRFVNAHTSGWTNLTGDVWQKTVSETVTQVRLNTEKETPFYRAANVADAATFFPETSGTYFFDAGTLTVNLGGIDPNTVQIDTVDSNSQTFIELGSSTQKVQNLRADGWGIAAGSTATQATGFRTANISGTTALIGCVSYFGTSHVMHYYAPSSVGGDCLFLDCSAGLANFNSAGETIFNAFSNSGGHRFVMRDCTVTGGCVPTSNWYAGARRIRGQAFLSHTAAGNESGLILVDGTKVEGGDFGCAWLGTASNLPDATDLADCRCFFVNESFSSSSAGLRVSRYAPINGCRINARVFGVLTNEVFRGPANTSHNLSCRLFNCRFEVDFTAVTSPAAWLNVASNQSFTAEHCEFIARSSVGKTIRFFNFPGAFLSPGVFLRNCLLGVSAAATADLRPLNVADGNAFYEFGASTTGDNPVTVTNGEEVATGFDPRFGDATFAAGVASPLRYDSNGTLRDRTNPSIGTIE